MSVRENIELYGLPGGERFVKILLDEYGASRHPSQANAYILESLPFYAPRPAEDHLSVLSFNNIPLPDSLIEVLVDHAELFPDDVLVRWTLEQDLILEATLGELRGRMAKIS